jgi:Zn ribbon nucleic-acid-binding protein
MTPGKCPICKNDLTLTVKDNGKIKFMECGVCGYGRPIENTENKTD